MIQQHRLSIANLQVRQKEGSIESATVQELASWVTDGSIKAMEVDLSPSTFKQRTESLSDCNVHNALILLVVLASVTIFCHGPIAP